MVQGSTLQDKDSQHKTHFTVKCISYIKTHGSYVNCGSFFSVLFMGLDFWENKTIENADIDSADF